MASEDAPLVADPVEPDIVSAEMHAASSARRDAKAVESTFLRSWSEAHKALFHKFVAEQEAIHKHVSLSELNDKVARQSQLVAKHMVDQCYVMSDGKLSVSAQLHATLSALRKCQSAATVKEHAAKEDKLDNRSKGWLEVRTMRFRVALSAKTDDTLRLLFGRSRGTIRQRPRTEWPTVTPKNSQLPAVCMHSLFCLLGVATAKRAASSSWR